MKTLLYRFMNGFSYSIGITVIIQVIVMLMSGPIFMVPEYMARFDHPVTAFAVNLLLIGIMSGITSAGTVIFEAKRIGSLTQSILFLVILLSAWIPVSCYAWGFHQYKASMITTILSITVTYMICWLIQYRLCKKNINVINAKLLAKKGD